MRLPFIIDGPQKELTGDADGDGISVSLHVESIAVQEKRYYFIASFNNIL